MLSENYKLGYLSLVLTVLLFSTLEFVSKTITYDIDPLQINFLRFLAAGILILPFTLSYTSKKQIHLSRQDFINLAVLGVVNVTISVSLLHVSLKYANASLVAVLFCTNPIFANIFDYLIYRKNLTPIKVVGIILGTAGMIVVFYTEIFIQSVNLFGIITALLSACSYGLYIVLAKATSDKLGGLIVNCYSFIIGALFLMPILLFLKIPLFLFDISVLPQMLYITLMLTIAAYFLFLFGLKFLPAGTGSLIFFAKPPLAILWAYLFLHETITIPFIIGSIIIMAGIAIYNYDLIRNNKEKKIE